MTAITEGNLAGAVKTDQVAFDAVHRAKRRDLLFAAGGLVVMAIAMTLLLTLIGDLVVRGLGRIDYAFLTEFPSRPGFTWKSTPRKAGFRT